MGWLFDELCKARQIRDIKCCNTMTISGTHRFEPILMMSIQIANKDKARISVQFLNVTHGRQETIVKGDRDNVYGWTISLVMVIFSPKENCITLETRVNRRKENDRDCPRLKGDGGNVYG